GAMYARYDLQRDRVDDGYPKPVTAGWSGIDGTGFESGIDTAVSLGNGKLYFFKGGSYLRIDERRLAVDAGAADIGGAWGGFAEAGFGAFLDSAVNWGNGKVYVFRGDSYLRYDIAADRVDDGYPLPVAGNWPGLAEAGFADSVDAVWTPAGAATPVTPVGGRLTPGDHVWYFDGRISMAQEIPRSTWFPGSKGPTDYQRH